MPYTTAFPDFPPSSMPCIPDTWEDTSWHLDSCPSFLTPKGHRVYVDYADPTMREHPDGSRFSALRVGNEVLVDTDDWEELLRVVDQAPVWDGED